MASITPARSPLLRRVWLAIFAVLAAGYLTWRWAFTLHPQYPIYSAFFALIETHALLGFIIFMWMTLERRRRPAPPVPARFPSVDVFIPTYNEDPALLRRTLLRVREMDGPHVTYVLDDGRRPAVRALAEELGCRYISRPTNEHYKAGNLNYALTQTNGELVVIFDADHVPRREFLSKLVGYFDDPQVGFVQTPQVYYNVDSFQHVYRPNARFLWHDNATFFHTIEPCVDRLEAASYLGTAAILRRRALEQAGGIAMPAITEDQATAMHIHAAGFRSVYHDEDLAYTLAPDTLPAYLQQRGRWASGNAELLRIDNPLANPGLTLAQRIVAFQILSHFASALHTLVYVLVPALYLLFDVAPLYITSPGAILVLAASVTIQLATYKVWLGRGESIFLHECFKLITWPMYLRAATVLVTTRNFQYKVTPKGLGDDRSLRPLWPAAAVFALGVIALGVGLADVAEAGSLGAMWGIAISSYFTLQHTLVAGWVLLYARDRLVSRQTFTFPDPRPVDITLPGHAAEEAELVRWNEERAYVRGDRALAVGSNATLVAALDDGPLEVKARVVETHRDPADPDLWITEVVLEPLQPDVLARLTRHFFEEVVPGCRAAASAGRRFRRRAGVLAEAYHPVRPELVGANPKPVRGALFITVVAAGCLAVAFVAVPWGRLLLAEIAPAPVATSLAPAIAATPVVASLDPGAIVFYSDAGSGQSTLSHAWTGDRRSPERLASLASGTGAAFCGSDAIEIVNDSPGWYLGVRRPILTADPADVRAFRYITFHVKGADVYQHFYVTLASDPRGARADEPLRRGNLLPVTFGNQWQRIVIPIDEVARGTDLDLTGVKEVLFSSHDGPIHAWIDDVQIADTATEGAHLHQVASYGGVPPPGWGDRLKLGFFRHPDFPSPGPDVGLFDYRYEYAIPTLDGAPGTTMTDWKPFVAQAKAAKQNAGFAFYGGFGFNSQAIAANLSDPARVRRYFESYVAWLDALAAIDAAHPYIIVIEPDLVPYLSQYYQPREPVTDAARMAVDMSAANTFIGGTFPSTFAGFAQAMVGEAKERLPQSVIGHPVATWSFVPGMLEAQDRQVEHAKEWAAFLNSLGSGRGDVFFAEKTDRDAGYVSSIRRQDDMHWDEREYRAYLTWVKNISGASGLRTIGWQISQGTSRNRDVPQNYRDDFAEYLAAHGGEFVDAGFIGVLFGRGAGESGGADPGETAPAVYQTEMYTDGGAFLDLMTRFRRPSLDRGRR